jgi:hypothetical protein
VTGADRRDYRRRRYQDDADRRLGADLLAGYARALAAAIPRFTNVVGDQVDAVDVAAALDDTGLTLIVDSEAAAGDALAVLLFAATPDPLDLDTAADGIDSHFDREQEGRDEADARRRLVGRGDPASEDT